MQRHRAQQMRCNAGALLVALVILVACQEAQGQAQAPVTPSRFEASAASSSNGQRVRPADSQWDGFGEAVAVQGDVAVIGASEWNYSGEGYAYIYRRVDGAWQEEARLAAEDRSPIPPQERRPLPGQRFGSDVALDGNLLAVGAPGADRMAGAVYVFEYEGQTWRQTAKLSPPQGDEPRNSGEQGAAVQKEWLVFGRMPRRQFGQLVALHGHRLAVGGDAQASAVYLFEREAHGWQLQATLGIPQREGSDLYMLNMDLYGDSLALSVYYVSEEQPYALYGLLLGEVVVHLYELVDGRWAETLQYRPAGEAPLFLREARLGAAVALEGIGDEATRLAIGLPGFPDLSGLSSDLRFFVGSAVGSAPDANEQATTAGFPPSPHQAGIVTLYERDRDGAWQEAAILMLADEDDMPEGGLFFQTPTEGMFDEERLREMVFPGYFWSSDPVTTFFGATVDLDGQRLAVTSGFAGATHLFARDADGAWRYEAAVRYDDGQVTEDYAHIVALSGQSLLLGTPGEFGNSAVFFDLTATLATP